MRESIGGTMLFWIVLFFLSIFIAFMASVIKYARIVKIKNSMINYIERQEGVKTKDEIRAQLKAYGYPDDGYYQICKFDVTRGAYYSLQLYSTFSFPIVNIAFNVSIKGETRTIETGTSIGGSEHEGVTLFLNNVCESDGTRGG